MPSGPVMFIQKKKVDVDIIRQVIERWKGPIPQKSILQNPFHLVKDLIGCR